MKFPSGSDIINSIVPLTTLWKRIDVSQVSSTSIQVGNNPGQVLDLIDNNFANGNGLQVWKDYKAANQLVKLKDGRIVFGANKCMDVPDGRAGNGVLPQIWDCGTDNPNQWWQIHYDTGGIEFRDSGYYLNVRDGFSGNGGRIQLWQYNPYDPNFKFQITTLVPSTNNGGSDWAITGAQNWMGMNVISFDDMCNRFPQVARYKDALRQAAADQNIHATFLAAIGMQESGLTSPSNGAGAYQFTDYNAWARWSNGGNRNNVVDSIWAGARYYRYLINYYNQNLYNAVQNYCGWLSFYWGDIGTWTAGNIPKSHQRRDNVDEEDLESSSVEGKAHHLKKAKERRGH